MRMKVVALPFDWVERHTIGAVRQGVSLESLLAGSLIQRRYGDSRDIISPVQRLLLCLNTVLALEDATHGLARAGMGASYPAIGLRMALGSSTLQGAITALARLYAMASDAVHIQLKTEQDTAIVSIHMQAIDERDLAYLEENYLAWTFIQCLHFLGRAPPLSEVTLRDPLHFNLGQPHWAMGGPVAYGAVTAFRFPRRLLSQPPATRAGDNVLWEAHQTWLAFLGASPSPAADRFVTTAGFVRFADLVRESGRSANTLRRRGADGGFRQARRRALADAASERLCASDDSVEAIAAELGYADARSFRRFLKAATGFTPQQVRDRRGAGLTETDARALRELEALSARMNL
jgi:AraC-like DNA-binding protein